MWFTLRCVDYVDGLHEQSGIRLGILDEHDEQLERGLHHQTELYTRVSVCACD